MKCNEFQSTAMIGVLLTAVMPVSAGEAVGTAFTYQGQLKQDGIATDGVFDFNFALYNDSGGLVAGPQCFNDVDVVNGLFTVELDFGLAAFLGDGRELHVDVCAGDGGDCGLLNAAPFTPLSPPQPIKAVPEQQAIIEKQQSRLEGFETLRTENAELHARTERIEHFRIRAARHEPAIVSPVLRPVL